MLIWYPSTSLNPFITSSKDIKGIEITKEEEKLYLFANGMILNMWNTKDAIE